MAKESKRQTNLEWNVSEPQIGRWFIACGGLLQLHLVLIERRPFETV